MRHLAFLFVFAFISCTAARTQTVAEKPNKAIITVNATLWQQTSGEYRALCYQAYSLAKLRFDEAIQKKYAKKPAVIVDIDETIIDNSVYQARLIVNNEEYSQPHWKKWTDGAQGIAIPGALEFLTYAVSKGADVYYITNRKTEETEGTVNNLIKTGFPQAEKSHVLFRTAESSKEKRRLMVAETHEVVLLCGDNLNDFTDLFEKKNIAERFDGVEKLKDEWGKKFIVIPNPIYGDWEGAIYDYQYSLSDSAKEAKRKAAFRIK